MVKVGFCCDKSETFGFVQKVIWIVLVVIIISLTTYFASAYDDANFSLSYQGKISDLSNNPVALYTPFRITLNASNGSQILSYVDVVDVFFGSSTGFDKVFTDLPLVYNEEYTLCLLVNSDSDSCFSFRSNTGLITGKSILDGSIQYSDLNTSSITFNYYNLTSNGSMSFYFNKTNNTYTGSLSFSGLTGYGAGNAICNSEFPTTHLCTQTEVLMTISHTNISAMSEWSGEAWTSTGSAKYSPADVPVNDCNGWTHGTAGSYLGNWWYFDSTNNKGGDGRTGHCGNSLPLACCK